MKTRFLIVGQGLCGTWLSFFLDQAGEDFQVIDPGEKNASSRIASGVINPVTGRRLHKTWMAETLLPFAYEQYTAMGKKLGISAIHETAIHNFFPTTQMLDAYREIASSDPQYVGPWTEGEEWKPFFNFNYGVGNIRPAYLIRLNTLLDNWRTYLRSRNRLIEARFYPHDLELKRNIRWKDIEAEKIIFCDGVAGQDNPWFNRLPFSANKGEALLVSIPDLPGKRIYKKGMTIVPWDEPGLFWVGSTYQNRFEDSNPTLAFREQALAVLKDFCKLPFTVVDHWSAVRPATVERRPFVGLHPSFPNVGILNGTGTKGCSLAPFFARQFTGVLLRGEGMEPAADVKRFHKTLGSGV